jgi:hypothetical protein
MLAAKVWAGWQPDSRLILRTAIGWRRSSGYYQALRSAGLDQAALCNVKLPEALSVLRRCLKVIDKFCDPYISSPVANREQRHVRATFSQFGRPPPVKK